jgi:hypothetical protein
MFGKVKDKKAKESLVSLLAFIASATQASPNYAVVPLVSVKELMKYEPTFVTINGEPDAGGSVNVSATPAGIAASGAPAPAPAATPSAFLIEDGIAVVESKRGGGLKSSTYPFADLKPGQSFFVAATEAKPTPAKGLGSTVSSANKRYASTYPMTTGKNKTPHPKAGQSTGQDGRKFTVRAVDEPAKGKGARIWRVS